MEMDRWQEMGISPSFAEPQISAVGAFVKMGVTPTMSCTPYLFPDYVPRRGDHLAWAESSAVAFANSVLGARTNREGGPSALAAAIVGRTPRYGYHLDSERRADVVIDVRCPLREVADFGALELRGRQAGGQRLSLVRQPGRLSAAAARGCDRGRQRGRPAEDPWARGWQPTAR